MLYETVNSVAGPSFKIYSFKHVKDQIIIIIIEDNYSQLIQYAILKKLVTYILTAVIRDGDERSVFYRFFHNKQIFTADIINC